MAPPGTALVASWYVCLVPAAPLIVLRLRARWKRHEKLGIDDFVFIAAILVVLGYNATIAYMWNQGLADWRAGFRIPKAQFDSMMQMLLPSRLLYISAAWAIKFAVVLFYRVVAPPGSRVVIMCYVVLCLLVVSWGGVFSFTLFGCRPWDKYWAGDLNQECPAEFAVTSWWLLTCSNISTNIIVVCMPITMVKNLDMRVRDKIAIGFMFVLGTAVITASSMQSYFNKQNDIMLSATACMIELSAGLIGTSLLALSKTLLGKHAFQASTAPRLSLALTPSHRQSHLNDINLLEAYKNEKDITITTTTHVKRSLSINNDVGVAISSWRSRTRISTGSKDSSVLPGQFHIGFTAEGDAEEEEWEDQGRKQRANKGIGSITICAADVGDLSQQQQRRSQTEVHSPGVESWFER